MSTEALRRAAALMRTDWRVARDMEGIALTDPHWRRAKTWLAVADWLDEQAVAYHFNAQAWTAGAADPENRWAERGLTVEGNLAHHHRHALAVARAYLQES